MIDTLNFFRCHLTQQHRCWKIGQNIGGTSKCFQVNHLCPSYTRFCVRCSDGANFTPLQLRMTCSIKYALDCMFCLHCILNHISCQHNRLKNLMHCDFTIQCQYIVTFSGTYMQYINPSKNI